METSLAQPRDVVNFWLPALVTGFLTWLAFLTLGETPLIRASGLTLAIVGVTLTLRRMGATLALIGGLTLAFSPAFWSQTGGGQSLLPATTVLATMIAGVVSVITIRLTRRPYITLGLGLLVFAIIFWDQIGTPRSLRLTGLLTAWLLVIMVQALLISNPRPNGPPSRPVGRQQYVGVLTILFVGIVNDPLFVLLVPAVAVGMWLSHTPLRGWYWGAMLVVAIIGMRGIAATYVDSTWLRVSAVEAHNTGVQVRYIIADGWHEGVRWLDLIKLVVKQITFVGAVLSVLGLTRMTRWYPVLGIVLMIAYASYALFGLVYFGRDREILLLPLFIIQVIWLTYAVYTFCQWLQKTGHPGAYKMRWIASGAYFLLPAYFLLQIA